MTAPTGDDALREALEHPLFRAIQEASWSTGVAMLDSDVVAFRRRVLAELLPVVLRYGRDKAAEAVQRVKAVPTYVLSNDDEPLGTVVLADDVLDALTTQDPA